TVPGRAYGMLERMWSARLFAVSRRRLLQAALAALLAAAGVWFYLSDRHDIEAGAGGERGAKNGAPASARGAGVSAASGRVPAVPPAPPAAARAVPAHPAEGALGSTPFRADGAWIEGGVLHLRQRAPAVILELVLPG